MVIITITLIRVKNVVLNCTGIICIRCMYTLKTYCDVLVLQKNVHFTNGQEKKTSKGDIFRNFRKNVGQVP